jgi:DNA repair exonuclease SbcCD ATPase subunit
VTTESNVHPHSEPPDLVNVRIAVGSLEKDMQTHIKVADKLTEAVQRIQEMNSNLCAMIKLHEQRHSQAEKIFEAFDTELKDIDARIDKVFDNPWYMAKNPNAKPERESTEERLRKIEHWMWMVAGGAMVAGALITLVLNVILGK